MAALTVDQAVQRLLHSVSRPGSHECLTTTSQTHHIGRRGSNGIFSSERSHGGRNRGHSRFSSNMTATATNGTTDSYFLTLRHGKSIGGPIHGAEEFNGDGSSRELFQMPASGSVVDVQRCLKNFIVTQNNRLTRQQQITEAKDREIEQLRRENNALKHALRTLEKRVPTANVAQQCDLSDTAEIKHTPAQYQWSTSQNGVEKNFTTSHATSLDTIGVGSVTRRSLEKKPETKTHSKRSRRSADDLTHEASNIQTSLINHLRSGRQRQTYDHDRKPPLKKRVRAGDKRESLAGMRLTRRRLTDNNGKSSSSKNKDEVQTPGWRITQYSAGGALEGTENITDEAIGKRHQKSELEERRVIRRDKMRQREELLKEKLIRAEQQNRLMKQRRDRNDSESSEAPPDIEKLEGVEVCDHLPKPSKTPKSTSDSPPAAKKRKSAK